jgi:hypothetical protein
LPGDVHVARRFGQVERAEVLVALTWLFAAFATVS